MAVKALLIIDDSGTVPLAQVDVLGASLVERTTDALLACGVTQISVVSAHGHAEEPHFRSPNIRQVTPSAEELWEQVKAAYEGLRDCDAVLVARMNSYTEIEWPRFFAKHQAKDERITRAWAGEAEPLDIYVVDPTFQRDVDFLLGNRLRHPRLPGAKYMVSESEYVHWLQNAGDLREITVDALNLRTGMRPVGREVRPGIWMGERARVDTGVRLVAPIFIGNYARVRMGAVITRGSTVEHHSTVDCGTVVENTSVLPFAAVGAGLDLVRTVIGNRQVTDLKRNVTVEVHDPILLSEMPHNAGVRVLTKAAALLSYLPLQFWRGVTQPDGQPALANNEAICSPDFAETVNPLFGKKQSAPAARALRPELVMERYGNQ